MTDPGVRERGIVQAPFFTDTQLKKRIEMNREARFGLETATAAQLNVVFILAKRWELDPVTDLTLFEGHPWITIDGWGRLLRRNPDFRGLACRPLSSTERQEWGYEKDDLVIEACVTTANWGEIRARGKVTAVERQVAANRAERTQRKAAPVAVHPVEIAEKRAIARAARLAFGQEVPDDAQIDEEMRSEIAERTDPARVKALSDKYDELWPPEDQTDAPAEVAVQAED